MTSVFDSLRFGSRQPSSPGQGCVLATDLASSRADTKLHSPRDMECRQHHVEAATGASISSLSDNCHRCRVPQRPKQQRHARKLMYGYKQLLDNLNLDQWRRLWDARRVLNVVPDFWETEKKKKKTCSGRIAAGRDLPSQCWALIIASHLVILLLSPFKSSVGQVGPITFNSQPLTVWLPLTISLCSFLPPSNTLRPFLVLV